MKKIYKTITAGELDSPLVRLLQEILIQNGSDLKRVDGLFGENTLYAVRVFQSKNFDTLGNPLIVDGIVGPQTWSCLFSGQNGFATVSPPLLTFAVLIALGEIGVREDPPYSNRGQDVERYLSCVGLGPEYPWCAAFVYACFDGASKQLGRVNPLVRTASSMNHWSKSQGQKIKIDEAMRYPHLIVPGTIFFIRRKNWSGHTGIVTGYYNGIISTIEGNASANYSGKGDGVVALERRFDSINVGFIKYS